MKKSMVMMLAVGLAHSMAYAAMPEVKECAACGILCNG